MAPGLLPALTGAKMINSDHFLAGKKIIVAGAGMAGLSFTIALRKKWSAQAATLPNVSITMYERDTKEETIGREGYSVSIRADSYSGGMQALKKLALLEMAVQVSLIGTKDDDRGFAVWDNQWKELMKLKARTPDVDLPAPTMRITRQALRKILVNAISPDDAINWSTSCTGARQLNNGKIQVQLSNGMVEECDILVAADGANSKIRASLRPEDKLRYSGATFICGDALFPDTGVPEPIKKDWGSVISGTGVGLFISPVSTHKATWSLSYLSPTPRATERQPLTQERAEAILQEALDRGRPYSQPFESIIRATDPFTISVFSATDKDPFAHIDKLQSYQHIIYIGDSNHAVTPLAANGANMALMDGVDLAESLCNSESLLAALIAYDSSSLPRSRHSLRASQWGVSIVHAQGWKLTLYSFIMRLIKPFFFKVNLKKN